MPNGQGVVAQKLQLKQWSLEDTIEVRHAVRQFVPERRVLEEHLAKNGKLPVTDAEAVAKWIMDDVEGFSGSVKKASSPLVRFLACQRRFDGGEREAIDDCRKIASEMKDPWCVPVIVEMLVKAGQTEQAEKMLAGAASSIEDHAFVEYLRGRIAEARNEWAVALEKYKSSLEKGPGLPQAAFRQAYLLDMRGQDEEALEAYSTAGLSKNRFVGALVNMGLLYEEKGELEKAITCFKEAQRALPADRRIALYLTAATEATQEVYDEAERKEMERVKKLLRTSLAEFELSVRSRNCLSRMGLTTLWDLVQKTEAELLSHKNFGETSLREIRALLAGKGLRLGMNREMSSQKAARQVLTTSAESAAVNPELLEQPVSSLNLSVRASNGLEVLGCKTIGDIVSRTEDELLAVKNFGQVSLNEVKNKLTTLGLTLKTPVKPET